MFEATLLAADPDRQRLQRLTLAAAIALASTAAGLASLWTLERLDIERVMGPTGHHELAEFSLLPAPKIEPPPPPPVFTDDEGEAGDDRPAPRGATLEEELDDDGDRGPSDALTQPASTIGKGIPGLPDAPGCTGPLCGTSTIPKPPGDPCFGPHCTKPPGAGGGGAPREVEFSALQCIACADPDQALLRKTASSLRKRSGTVVARFCVDTRGRVESSSVKISRSFGDAAVDDITRAAIRQWRFSPMKVAGKAHRTCSRAEFEIRFD